MGEQQLDKQVPVRFSDPLASRAKQLASQDNMTLSAWIRRLIDRELAAREGHCGTCGQPIERTSNE